MKLAHTLLSSCDSVMDEYVLYVVCMRLVMESWDCSTTFGHHTKSGAKLVWVAGLHRCLVVMITLNSVISPSTKPTKHKYNHARVPMHVVVTSSNNINRTKCQTIHSQEPHKYKSSVLSGGGHVN